MPHYIPPSPLVPWNAMMSPKLAHTVLRAIVLPRNGPDDAHVLIAIGKLELIKPYIPTLCEQCCVCLVKQDKVDRGHSPGGWVPTTLELPENSNKKLII